jgi:arylsulfatase A-like enzyme
VKTTIGDGEAEARVDRVRALLIVLVVGALVACGGDAPRNLLLISVDTLRADHLGYAGHDRPTSPNLDALAAESTVFENAYSAAGWTLPSMATVMTGQYPVLLRMVTSVTFSSTRDMDSASGSMYTTPRC